MITKPTVNVLATTQLAGTFNHSDFVYEYFDKYQESPLFRRTLDNISGNDDIAEYLEETDANPGESLIEFAGRACYQSFHRPNPATAAVPDYIKNILDQGHESVLEHSSATFYIEGVSRNLTHELIRHRHLSFSQLSQRFVNESEAEFVLPPALQDADEDTLDGVDGAVDYSGYYYDSLVEYLQKDQGLPRKKAREAARSVLPGNTETKIVVTGNFRAWRDVLKKRLDPSADAEIRRLSEHILVSLLMIAPAVFRDIHEEFYG